MSRAELWFGKEMDSTGMSRRIAYSRPQMKGSSVKKKVSRKGAKAQRKDAKKAFKIKSHSTLCVLIFAPLRLCGKYSFIEV